VKAVNGWAAAGLAMMVATSAAGAQVTVAGNFGPGDSYLTLNANSWGTGSDPGSGRYSENAVGFTSSLAQAATLDRVRVAFNFFTGTDPGITLTLLEGSDINTATPLESAILVFPFVSQQFGTGELSPILSWSSVVHSLIQPGQQYWLARRRARRRATSAGSRIRWARPATRRGSPSGARGSRPRA
jgi:hypothetical protein